MTVFDNYSMEDYAGTLVEDVLSHTSANECLSNQLLSSVQLKLLRFMVPGIETDNISINSKSVNSDNRRNADANMLLRTAFAQLNISDPATAVYQSIDALDSQIDDTTLALPLGRASMLLAAKLDFLDLAPAMI